MTSAELEVYFYCFRDDLEHAETNVYMQRELSHR